MEICKLITSHVAINKSFFSPDGGFPVRIMKSPTILILVAFVVLLVRSSTGAYKCTTKYLKKDCNFCKCNIKSGRMIVLESCVTSIHTKMAN